MAGQTDDAEPGARTYRIGDVGKGARVAQGENITWLEGVQPQVGGDELRQQLTQLVERLAEAPELDEDERDLAIEKTKAVAEALGRAQESPEGLRKSLRDARAFLTSSAGWAWEGLCRALTGPGAQEIISGISEAGVKGAIRGVIGAP